MPSKKVVVDREMVRSGVQVSCKSMQQGAAAQPPPHSQVMLERILGADFGKHLPTLRTSSELSSALQSPHDLVSSPHKPVLPCSQCTDNISRPCTCTAGCEPACPHPLTCKAIRARSSVAQASRAHCPGCSPARSA